VQQQLSTMLLQRLIPLWRPTEADFKSWQQGLEVKCSQRGLSMKHPLIDVGSSYRSYLSDLYEQHCQTVELVIDEQLSRRYLSQPIRLTVRSTSSIQPNELITYYGGIALPESFYEPGGPSDHHPPPSSYAIRSVNSDLIFNGAPFAAMFTRPTPMRESTFKQILMDGIKPLRPTEHDWTLDQIDRFQDEPFGFLIRPTKKAELANCKIDWLSIEKEHKSKCDPETHFLVPAIKALCEIAPGIELVVLIDQDTIHYQPEVESNEAADSTHFPLVRSKKMNKPILQSQPTSSTTSSTTSSPTSSSTSISSTSTTAEPSGWDLDVGESISPPILLPPAFAPNDVPIIEWPEDWEEEAWDTLHHYWYDLDEALTAAEQRGITLNQYYKDSHNNFNKYYRQRHLYYQTQLRERRLKVQSDPLELYD
jgi:hypothetical protein